MPLKAGDRAHWQGLPGAASSLVIAALTAEQRDNAITLIITEDTVTAEQYQRELSFFLAGAEINLPVLTFPDWETLIYDGFSPHQDIISARLDVLDHLTSGHAAIVIVPANTLMYRLPPRRFLSGGSLNLKVGASFDMTTMRRRLEANAYRCVETVFEHGEFAVRGAIMDIFPMGSDAPYRVDLFDNEIETLRTFDTETQRSIDKVDAINLLPAREYPLSDEAISLFKDNWAQRFDVDPRLCNLYVDVAQGLSPPGIEYYLPLFFDEMQTLFDYLPDDLLVITTDIETTLRQYWSNATDRYESLRYDIQRPILAPEDILLTPDELFTLMRQYRRIDVRTAEDQHSPFQVLPELTVDDRANQPVARLHQFTEAASGPRRVLLAAESAGRREVVDELLRKYGLNAQFVETWQEFSSATAPLCLTVADIDRGLHHLAPDVALVTEQQLFGERVLQKRRRQIERDNAAELVVRSLTELTLGAPVVHIDHGVGRYQGLVSLTVDDQENEFLCLSYQEDARLYVPVSSLHLISRYTGAEEDVAPLHRLGGEVWQKAKKKAATQIRDVAAELLNIYARRDARKGFAYPEPDDHYQRFAAEFPFEETADQETAIDSVIADMTRDKPMDRLICGDVGFGKTEVAMRAAFLAVQAGRQVAVLVPTTLLARQHNETFKDRFANWPITIDSISRFKNKKEQAEVISQLRTGKLDVVIGTHALIQEGLDFKNLGLLIIDEEHRFGVRQKEKLKSLRSEVDILTMTATPIPRTLNMAMAGMRDLSIIATPPARRLSIKTFVQLRNEGLLREAIQRELLRGGQVYYLHNEVRDIEQTADKIAELVPEARIAIGHGQMRERELEQVMSDFYHKRANILVCTTIIETGIDVPNANTIIIDRADRFGLAQIHQLRGRVGRSHHQAYAYLLTPHPKMMTSDAVKRLDAIAEAEDLGAGFILATHDLEIRGAGELLGEEQTGNMQTIGFSLYMEMLDRAVKAIQDGKTPNLDRPLREDTEVNLRVPAIIPTDYLPDVHTRLVLYKRIANADNDERLRELQVEMIDRFGLLPEATRYLFRITALKLQAQALGIKKLDAGPVQAKLEFDQETSVDAGAIVNLVQSEPHRYRLGNANQLHVTEKMEKPEQRFTKMTRLLERLASRQVAATG